MSTVEIETRYVPVPVKLLPRESINSKWSVKFAFLRLMSLLQIKAYYG
jgi:hypothetical protein